MTTQPSGHGGPRQGTPGASYTNRSDLNANRAPAAGQATTGAETPRPQFTTPDETPSIGDPSGDQRPLTAGLPVGPGAGPEGLTQGPGISNDRTIMMLQTLYKETGSDFLLRLVNQAQAMRDMAGPQ